MALPNLLAREAKPPQLTYVLLGFIRFFEGLLRRCLLHWLIVWNPPHYINNTLYFIRDRLLHGQPVTVDY